MSSFWDSERSDPSPTGWDFATFSIAWAGFRHPAGFTTSHPRDFVKAIIDVIDENPAQNHVHLPVQSDQADPEQHAATLHRMNTCAASVEKNARRDISSPPTLSRLPRRDR
jgi:hypothetical protein